MRYPERGCQWPLFYCCKWTPLSDRCYYTVCFPALGCYSSPWCNSGEQAYVLSFSGLYIITGDLIPSIIKGIWEIHFTFLMRVVRGRFHLWSCRIKTGKISWAAPLKLINKHISDTSKIIGSDSICTFHVAIIKKAQSLMKSVTCCSAAGLTFKSNI